MDSYRDGADLDDSLELEKMPNGVDWNGAIAFLDRDGVLNIGSADYVNNVSELIVIEGVAKSVGDLRRNGYRICVVTNQSPIGRGFWDHERLHSIHQELKIRLLEKDKDAALDLILYCPYAPWDNSECRKPRSGMLRDGQRILKNNSGMKCGNEIARSVMVGDRHTDIVAGIAFGLRSFFIRGSGGLCEVIDRVLDEKDDGDKIEDL